MNCVELLAPAKNLETGIAAINSGADAIYIGAPYFGARVNAGNSLTDIEKLVNYAHKFYVKVHVTINTILNDNELKEAIDLIHKLYNIGVDAIIIQDFGILEAAVNGKLPPIQIHMSTQCDNRTLDKVQFFDNIGVSRVILARELSVDKIAEICKNVDCEIETFIHGALCVSYSGQCYMSYANGGRSANRGECAQPCRKRYSLVDENNKVLLSNQYLLSMKDFNASESIEKLINCGVKSFKIEGRLKDLNYVKNVTLFYNNLINKYAHRTSSGRVFTEFSPNINKTFNRFYTDYFLEKRNECYNFTSPKFIGERVGIVKKSCKDFVITDAKLAPQDGICYIEDGEVKGFMVNKVSGNKVYLNNPRIIHENTVLYRNFDAVFDKSLNNSDIRRRVGVNIKVYEDKVLACDEDNNSVFIDINSVEIANNFENARNNFISQLSKSGETEFYIIDVDIMCKKLPFLPISGINELRRTLLHNLMEQRLKNYKQKLQKPIKYSTFPLENLDYRANVLNKFALKFYENCNCKITEMALEKSNSIPRNVELMRMKHCLRYAAGICLKGNSGKCSKLFLVDENGKRYPLVFDCKNCEMVVLNP